MLQTQRGQVKVATYANSGLLTVHVVQARNLQSKWQAKCNAFVKVLIHPEADGSTKCRTEIISDNNQPKFEEKFSFELLEDDLKKRILISAWHQEQDTGHDEFLGCLSFGIQHIVSNRRNVDGWYYLLNEKLGQRKHLQVSANNTVSDVNVSVVPKINQELLCMEPYVFVIKKEVGQIHGIDVTGEFPAIVSDITPGSAAESVGLQVGDKIVRINGFNVSRSGAESVGRILRSRSCETQIVLEIHRPRSSSRPRPLTAQGHSQLNTTAYAVNVNQENLKAPKGDHLDIRPAVTDGNYIDQAFVRSVKYGGSLAHLPGYNAPVQTPAFHNALQKEDASEYTCDNMFDDDDDWSHLRNASEKSTQSRVHALTQSRPRMALPSGLDVVDTGYCSEGHAMRRPPLSLGAQNVSLRRNTDIDGYASDSRAIRRINTRPSAADGYASECQSLRRRTQSQVCPAIPENEVYEPDGCPDCQQPRVINQPESSAVNTSRMTQSRGVNTAGTEIEGCPYVSQVPPMATSNRRSSVSMAIRGDPAGGYHSEGGSGMRFRRNDHTQPNLDADTGYYSESAYGMRRRDNTRLYNAGHAQVVNKTMLERMYHRGNEDDEFDCAYHGSKLEEHLALNGVPMEERKRSKVCAWLQNIPDDPKELHQNTTDQPLVGNTKHGSQPSGIGLNPIYEEPECSVSMLTHKRHQLEPIPEDRVSDNKENRLGKKAGSVGGVKLFALCGGIAPKRKKKKNFMC